MPKAARAVASTAMAMAAALLLLAGAAVAGASRAAATPPQSRAADTIAPPDCALGVCALNIAATLSIAPCEDDPIVVAYTQADGTTLLQCDRSSDGARNLGYLFDRQRRGGPVYAFEGLRVFSAAALPDLVAHGVPDVFTFKPLCAAGRSPPVAEGQMLLLTKAAGAHGAVCYRILRAGADAHGVFLRADAGPSPRPSVAARATWDTLAAQMLRLLPVDGPGSASAAPSDPPVARMTPDDPRATADTARGTPKLLPRPAPVAAGVSAHAGTTAPTSATAGISARQAYLYDVPEPGLASHTYLDRGDIVTVLDATRAGWVKVRYIGPAGRPIERWVHAADVDLAARDARTATRSSDGRPAPR